MVNKVKISELPHHGLFCMLYGVAGVGKTWNCLKTLPKKICYMPSEPRGYRRTTDAIGLKDSDAELITWEGIEDLLEFLTVVENFDPYKSVFFDSLTYTMNQDLTREVTKESYDAKGNVDKPIESQMKLSMPGRGLVNTATFRILGALANIAAYGKTVVLTCLEQSNPKWDRTLSGGPVLSGKEVPNNFDGFFDLIGRVYPHTDKDGQLSYPPAVSFASTGDYTAKATGDMGKKVWPLNFEKILQTNKQKEN